MKYLAIGSLAVVLAFAAAAWAQQPTPAAKPVNVSDQIAELKAEISALKAQLAASRVQPEEELPPPPEPIPAVPRPQSQIPPHNQQNFPPQPPMPMVAPQQIIPGPVIVEVPAAIVAPPPPVFVYPPPFLPNGVYVGNGRVNISVGGLNFGFNTRGGGKRRRYRERDDD